MLARICPGLWNAFVQTRKSLLLTYTAAGLTAHLVKFWLDFSPSVGTVEQGITPTLVRDGSSSRTLLHQRTLGRQIAPLWSLVQVAAKTKHSPPAAPRPPGGWKFWLYFSLCSAMSRLKVPEIIQNTRLA